MCVRPPVLVLVILSILATGTGYRLVISKLAGCDVDVVTSTLQKHIPQVRLESCVGAELTYSLPHDSAHMFPIVFNTLDLEKEVLRVVNYGLTATTMNKVFLRFEFVRACVCVRMCVCVHVCARMSHMGSSRLARFYLQISAHTHLH